MSTTLAERLQIAMSGPPKVSQVALAKACGVSAPSVSDWCRGITKSIEGVYLVRAASFLNVRPRWLAEGVGPRQPDNPFATSEHRVSEPGANVINAARAKAQRMLDQLPEHLLEEAMSHMEWLIERDKKINPHDSNGHSISGRS